MLQRGRLRHRRRRRRAAWRPTASTSRRRPAARRACSRTWRTTSRPSGRTCKVWLTSTTEQWAVIAVQGPKAREVLAPLVEGIDLSREAHAAHERARRPHLRRADAAVPRQLHRRARLRDQRAGRLRRAPSGRRSASAGQAHGITPYGTEAMHVLRAEKGYIIVGQETDGTVTPDDLGLGWADRQDQARLRRQALAARGRTCVAPDRKQLVGLLTDDPADRARGRRADRRRAGASRCRCACSATSRRPTEAPRSALDRARAGRPAGAPGSASAFT